MPHVLIVGAGPAGASLAHLLAHRGIEVTLLERQSDFSREFRGEVLMPSGVDALRDMGLERLLADVPTFTPQRFAAYMNGRPIIEAEMDPDFFGGMPPLAVSQTGLLEAIVADAAECAGFHLERGASVKDLVVEDGRVVGVRARLRDGERTFRADLVVGTDGRASIVRRRGGFPVREVDQPMDIVWCKVPCPEAWTGARVYLGRGHMLLAYHTWDDRLQVGWVILKGAFGDLRGRGIEQWVEEMASQVTPDFAAHLRANQASIEHPVLLDVVSDCVDGWSAPGVLLLGDAAHTMSPVGGQGVNIALRDVVVAANHLVPALRADGTPEQIDAAAARIEAERMPEVGPLQALQAQPPKVVLTRAWWGEPLRSTLAGILRTGIVQPVARRQAGRFMFGLTDVHLRV